VSTFRLPGLKARVCLRPERSTEALPYKMQTMMVTTYEFVIILIESQFLLTSLSKLSSLLSKWGPFNNNLQPFMLKVFSKPR